MVETDGSILNDDEEIKNAINQMEAHWLYVEISVYINNELDCIIYQSAPYFNILSGRLPGDDLTGIPPQVQYRSRVHIADTTIDNIDKSKVQTFDIYDINTYNPSIEFMPFIYKKVCPIVFGVSEVAVHHIKLLKRK